MKSVHRLGRLCLTRNKDIVHVFSVSSMLALCFFLLVHACIAGSTESNSFQQRRRLDTQLTGAVYYNEMYYSDNQCSQLLFTRSVLSNTCYYTSISNTGAMSTFDYVINSVISIGSSGYLLTQNYFTDNKCAIPDRGRLPTVNLNAPAQCQATNIAGPNPYLYVKASVSTASPSAPAGGITVNGFGSQDCSGMPAEVSYFAGNAAGTFINNAATACVGMYAGLCGVNSAGISFYPYAYPPTSGTCTGTTVGKYTYNKACTAKGYLGLGGWQHVYGCVCVCVCILRVCVCVLLCVQSMRVVVRICIVYVLKCVFVLLMHSLAITAFDIYPAPALHSEPFLIPFLPLSIPAPSPTTVNPTHRCRLLRHIQLQRHQRIRCCSCLLRIH